MCIGVENQVRHLPQLPVGRPCRHAVRPRYERQAPCMACVKGWPQVKQRVSSGNGAACVGDADG